MAERISVSPTPIQRNKFDVAMELTKIHVGSFGFGDGKELETIFATYFALARYCERTEPELLRNLLSEELVSNLKEFKPYPGKL